MSVNDSHTLWNNADRETLKHSMYVRTGYLLSDMLRACLQLGSDERNNLLPVCRGAASLHHHQHGGRLTGLLYLLSVVCLSVVCLSVVCASVVLLSDCLIVCCQLSVGHHGLSSRQPTRVQPAPISWKT